MLLNMARPHIEDELAQVPYRQVQLVHAVVQLPGCCRLTVLQGQSLQLQSDSEKPMDAVLVESPRNALPLRYQGPLRSAVQGVANN